MILMDGSQEFQNRWIRARNIAIISHRKPDGDTLGSNLALALLSENAGKHAISFCVDPAPKRLQFLPGVDRLTSDSEVFSRFPVDLVVTVDGGDLERLGMTEVIRDWKNERALEIVNVDHHAINRQFGAVNIVDEHAASTTYVLYRLFRQWRVPITADIATCLLCGIMTDTGSFSNLATTAEAMQASSELLGLGGRMKEVVQHTFQYQEVRSLKLWGLAFARLKRDPKTGVVTTLITEEDIRALNADHEDIEGVSNFLNGLSDATMVILYVQGASGEVRASLRTVQEAVDVSQIAVRHGGGGHKKAAGFTALGYVTEETNRWVFVPKP